MRIAFDAKRFFHNATGLGRYSRELVEGLSRFYPNEEYFLCNPSRDVPTHGLRHALVTPAFDLKLYGRFWRAVGVVRDLKKNGVQLYHGLSAELPFRLRANRIRSVVSVHDMIFLRYPNLYTRADRWIYERKVVYAATHADVVIATSLQTADDIGFFYPVRPNRIVVVYQSVSMPQTTEAFERSVVGKYKLPDRYFLYVGRIEERKNLLGVLSAMRRSERWKLAVVGRPHDPYYKQCLRFIDEHKLQNRVSFHADVSREELSVFYKKSLALLYPSFFEGFGIPIVEAQCAGTAVITTEGGCFGETAGEAALFVDPNDDDTIANAMSKIDIDAALRNRLVDLGLKNAQRFSQEQFAASVMGVYKQLL